jgi:hypothetical protein
VPTGMVRVRLLFDFYASLGNELDRFHALRFDEGYEITRSTDSNICGSRKRSRKPGSAKIRLDLMERAAGNVEASRVVRPRPNRPAHYVAFWPVASLEAVPRYVCNWGQTGSD